MKSTLPRREMRPALPLPGEKGEVSSPSPSPLAGERVGVRGPPSLLAAVALAAAALACAAPAALDRPGPPAHDASARELAVAGLKAYVVRNDAVTAASRFGEATRKDPREPWARYGAALLARRGLDDAAEVKDLVALVEAAPSHPLAPVAARRLGELAERAPALARAVEEGLSRAQARGELRALAALRVRSARIAAAGASGDLGRAARLRAEQGAVTSWALAGPFGALHALEIDAPFAPEVGAWPAEAPALPGAGALPSRALPCPDGLLTLDGEPMRGDIYYAAAEVTLARGGDYLLALGGDATLRAFLDGRPVLERRAYAGFPPASQAVALALPAGRHRLLVKIGRGGARGHLAASLARADGTPSDASFDAPARGASAPPVRPAPLPAPLNLAADLARRLEREVPPPVARLVAARDALDGDREAAKALLEEAVAAAPGSAPLLALRAEARRDDPTLSERVARARAEADLERALAADRDDAAALLARAELARAGGRSEDAAALLEGLLDPAASRPRALIARARLAQARGVNDAAERLGEEARRRGGDCAALELLSELARARDAVSREDEVVAAQASCPGGRERAFEHRRRRGDLAAARAAADELVRAAPARIEPRLWRAELLVASGEARAAVEDLSDLARLWPRDARIAKRRAEALEAAGDRAGARAARERALALDGADLRLRRAVSLDEGKEPLDDVAVDGAAALAAYRAAAPRYGSAGATVLDFGALEVHPDGAQTERVHVVVDARDQRAVEKVGEVSVPAGAEILIARTLKRDGRVLEADDPTGDKHTLSLPGLEPGDFAEWEWVRPVPARGPAVPGFSADAFFFRGDTPLWRSTYVVTAPRGARLEVDAHGMPPPPVTVEGDREVMRVVREDVPALLPEPHAPGESEYVPFVQVGAGADDGELARAMSDALAATFRPSEEVRALARQIRDALPGPARATDALPRAAYRRVMDVVLGQGGSFSEGAGAILSRGRGSRTVLLKSVLDALGVRSRLALVRDFSRDPASFRFPRPDLREAAVLLVEHGGTSAWLDPGTRGNPYGVLPPALRGADALVLPGPGEAARRARTPDDDGTDRRLMRVRIAFDEGGGAIAEGEERYGGFEGAALRGQLEHLDAQARRQAVEQVLSRSFRSPALTALEVDGEKDLDAPLVLRWRARVESWARVDGSRAIADVPLFPTHLGARFVQRAARESPLLVSATEASSLAVEVVPPPGWRPAPRERSEVRSRFGRYERVERDVGGALRRSDEYDLARGRIAPGDYTAFATHAAAVDAAGEAPMVFERSTPGAPSPVARRR